VARHEDEPLSPFPGSLALAAGLAAVAGCLDAGSLFRLTGTFVAFQSGNTVLMGVGIGQGDWTRVWPLLAAVLTYIVGSALTPFVIRAGGGVAGARRRLLVSASALLAADALIVLVGFGTGDETPRGFLRYLGIVVATIAMTMQTAVVRSVDGVSVSSTFSSGMLVRLGQGLGELTRRDFRARELPVVRILAITNLAFLGGAIVGGVTIEAWGNLAILIPTLALPLIAVLVERPGPAR
jgi:uncharacterized membrane protein YoaK (UPF0700 family)